MNKVFVFLIIILSSSCQPRVEIKDKLGLADKLQGEWKAKAFDGYLFDTWNLDTDGFMTQKGVYVEGKDTLYEAITRIEELEETARLFMILKDEKTRFLDEEQQMQLSRLFPS